MAVMFSQYLGPLTVVLQVTVILLTLSVTGKIEGAANCAAVKPFQGLHFHPDQYKNICSTCAFDGIAVTVLEVAR